VSLICVILMNKKKKNIKKNWVCKLLHDIERTSIKQHEEEEE
jgi:hypothetical protein